MNVEDRQAMEWVCSYCETRYAEYVNGCPRCHFWEIGTSSSVRLWPMGLTTEERQVFWAFWDTAKTEYVSKMAAAGGAFVAALSHRDKRVAELEAEHKRLYVHNVALRASHAKISHLAAIGTLTNQAAKVLATKSLEEHRQWYEDDRDKRIAELEADLLAWKKIVLRCRRIVREAESVVASLEDSVEPDGSVNVPVQYVCWLDSAIKEAREAEQAAEAARRK